MSQECVVAVYPTFDKARDAIQALDASGFPPEQVSFVTHSVENEVPHTDALEYGDKAEGNAATGAGMGSLIGVLLSTPLMTVGSLGAMLIAGPIAMGLAGAIVGGFLGAMSGWGVDADHVQQYEEKVAAGDLLVVANGDPHEVAEAEQILRQTAAAEVHLHAATSADSVET